MSETSNQAPDLSVVIAIVSDTTGPADARHLVDCLGSLSSQCEENSVELIVPHLDDVVGLAEIKAQFPQVLLLPARQVKAVSAGGREHHDVLRAHGLSAATGEVVALVEDHVRVDEQFCANVIAAHRRCDAVIGGAMDNAVDRVLNWAVYFCDFGRYQNPVPEGESPFASDANVSYKRTMLNSIRETWQASFREVVVNEALRARGEKVILCSEIVVSQNRSGLGLFDALRERYIWGRSYGATRNAMLSLPKRLILALLSPILPVVLTYRIAKTAWQRRRLFLKFVGCCHLIVLLQISWSLGECLGYLRGVRS